MKFERDVSGDVKANGLLGVKGSFYFEIAKFGIDMGRHPMLIRKHRASPYANIYT